MIFLLLLGASGTILLLQTGAGWHSDPRAVRNDSQYNKITGPAQPAPPKSEDFLKSFSISRADNEVVIQYSADRQDPVRLLNYTVHRRPAGEAFPLNQGELRLELISSGYGPFPPEDLDSYDIHVEPEHFNPAGEQLSSEQAKEILPDHSRREEIGYGGQYPAYRFILKHSPEEELKFIGYHIFDSWTKSSLSSGYGWGSLGDSHAFVEMDVERWHAGPAELIVDIGLGPAETVDLEPKVGAALRREDWALHVAAIEPGESGGFSTSSNSTNTTFKLRMKPGAEDQGAVFLLAGTPWSYHLPVDFEFLDKDGRKLRGGGGSSSSDYRLLKLREPLEKLDRIRATVYPNVKRLIFELPALPGLPEANQNVDNLFNVRVPYLRIRREYEFREIIQDLTQLRFDYPTPNLKTPPGFFPVTYEDISVEELLENYARWTTTNAPPRVAIDPEEHEIRFEEPFWKETLEKLARFFKKN